MINFYRKVFFIFITVLLSGCGEKNSVIDKKLRYCEVCFINTSFQSDSKIKFSVIGNESIFDLGKKLEKNEIINDWKIFVIISFLKNATRNIKNGNYQFYKNMSYRDVVNILKKGMDIVHKITIPEGITAFNIKQRINEHSCLKGDFIEKIIEGSVLPGTYFFSDKDSRQNILDRMTTSLEALVLDLTKKHKVPLNLSKDEIITLASIIEKETNIKDEKKLVASVFLNRLEKGMKLQADPTVIYGITMGEKKLGRSLLRKDWKFESPYNTYLKKGLPPTPICCPSKDSINSIFDAEKTNFFYFVAASDKNGHIFSEDLKKHNINVSKSSSKKKQKN